LSFIRSEDWITPSTLIHIIAFSITLIHSLIIDVVMATNKIGQCIMVRSSKNQQRKEKKIYTFQLVMDEMKGCINKISTRDQTRFSRTWFILYDIVFVFYYYNCQNNLILIIIVIFLFIWHYFRIIYYRAYISHYKTRVLLRFQTQSRLVAHKIDVLLSFLYCFILFIKFFFANMDPSIFFYFIYFS
jgi:hypothetical protein